MKDDLDPPSFQFQHAGRRRRREADPPPEPEPGGSVGEDETDGSEAERRPPRGGEASRRVPPGPLDPSLEGGPVREPEPFEPGVEPFAPEAEPFAPEPRRERGAAPAVRRGGEEPEARLRPGRARRAGMFRGETSRRVLWALPWAAFAIAIIAAGGAVFALALAALSVVGLRELFAMTSAARPLELPAYAAAVAMIAAAHFGESFHVLLAFAASFPAIFAFAARRNDREQITISIAITVLGIAWIGGALAHGVLLRELPQFGGGLLVDVVIATIAADTAAYAGGRAFGTRKITPRISPNKTLEGLLWGFAGGAFGFWAAGLYQDWLPGVDALLMGLAVGAIAPVGDLFSSMIKRDWGTKDTGRVFGPHGGLLDRLDAITFTVVLGYYLSIAFVY